MSSSSHHGRASNNLRLDMLYTVSYRLHTHTGRTHNTNEPSCEKWGNVGKCGACEERVWREGERMVVLRMTPLHGAVVQCHDGAEAFLDCCALHVHAARRTHSLTTTRGRGEGRQGTSAVYTLPPSRETTHPYATCTRKSTPIVALTSSLGNHCLYGLDAASLTLEAQSGGGGRDKLGQS